MKVWLVGDCGVEHHNVRYICLSKETALKRWEEVRQELIKDTERCLERCKKEGYGTEMDEEILKNLSETDPEKMDNYPQDQPFIDEMETEE